MKKIINSLCNDLNLEGGMKAVIWTDVLQTVVILVGLLATIVQGFIELGGIKQTFLIAYQGNRIQLDRYVKILQFLKGKNRYFICKNSVSFDPRVRHTVWSLLIGGSLNSLSTYGFNQTQVQRYMCIRTTRGAQQALLINAIGTALVIILCAVIGLILYAYYANCDPYTAKYVSSLDQIFPYFVMEVLSDKKGLPGIFLACIFSGSLSTVSSGLNSLAAVIIEDVYKGLMKQQLNDERQGFISKIISVLLGCIVILLTYIVSYLGSILNAGLSLFGVFSGPIMGVFFLGFFVPQANHHGGFIGFLVSLSLQIWILLGVQFTKTQMKNERLPFSIANCSIPINITTTIKTNSSISSPRNPLLNFYSISYMWYTPIAVSVVLIVGIIVSYLTRSKNSNIADQKLLITIHDISYSCLPASLHRWFGCCQNNENTKVTYSSNTTISIIIK